MMAHRYKKYTGFTIVELLIVIVVIAILAAISVVAYTGMQDKAADAAIQSDIRNLAMQVREYHALNDTFPAGGGNDNPSIFSGIKAKANKAMYQRGINNLYYCGVSNGPNAKFAIAARSRSGNTVAYYDGAFKSYTGAWTVNTVICANMGIDVSDPAYSFAWGQTSANAWNAWIE